MEGQGGAGRAQGAQTLPTQFLQPINEGQLWQIEAAICECVWRLHNPESVNERAQQARKLLTLGWVLAQFAFIDPCSPPQLLLVIPSHTSLVYVLRLYKYLCSMQKS